MLLLRKQFWRKQYVQRSRNTTIPPRNAVTVLQRGPVTVPGLGVRHRERDPTVTTTTRSSTTTTTIYTQSLSIVPSLKTLTHGYTDIMPRKMPLVDSKTSDESDPDADTDDNSILIPVGHGLYTKFVLNKDTKLDFNFLDFIWLSLLSAARHKSSVRSVSLGQAWIRK